MSATWTSGGTPVAAAEADTLFALFSKFDCLLLAVSGGVDSMAMLELVAEWARSKTAPQIFVATVDHGLRPEARDEAAFVALRSRALGLPHATLEWLGEKPETGVANAARQARYALLREHAERIAGARSIAIVTAHTEDDQAETFLMRLARGSGVDGLAGIAPERRLEDASDIALVRPLLGISKARLAATLEARGLEWREDPSNRDAAYERVRVRSTLTRLAEDGVGAAAIATSARRLRDAGEALRYADCAFEASLAIDFNDELYGSLARAPFQSAPALLRQRLLAKLIARFGGDTAAPELAEVEELASRIATSRPDRFTLGGAVLTLKAETLMIWREAGRIERRATPLALGAAALWDNRFWLSREGRPDLALAVRPLGRDGAKRLGLDWPPSRRAPASAIEAAPAVWLDDQPIAAPSLAKFAAPPQHEAYPGLRLSAEPAAGRSAGI